MDITDRIEAMRDEVLQTLANTPQHQTVTIFTLTQRLNVLNEILNKPSVRGAGKKSGASKKRTTPVPASEDSA